MNTPPATAGGFILFVFLIYASSLLLKQSVIPNLIWNLRRLLFVAVYKIVIPQGFCGESPASIFVSKCLHFY